jgi:4-azaleucine resistance transporter AzlC
MVAVALEREGFSVGARAIMPLAPAAAAFGLSFGVLARTAGMGRLAPVVMSATTFAGSAQVATVSVVGAGGSAVAAITAALLLNARYGAISISIGPAFQGGFWKRLLESQLIVDESWAIAVRSNGRVDRRTVLGAGAMLWVAWVAGTAVGAFVTIGDPNSLGLDGAFPALFLALLVRQLRGRLSVAAAALGAVIAFVLIPFTPAGIPVIAAASACLLGLVRQP